MSTNLELPVLARLLRGFSTRWPFWRGRTRLTQLYSCLLAGGDTHYLVPYADSTVKAHIPCSEFSGLSLLAFGESDEFVWRFIKISMQQSVADSVFIDVGANLGTFSLRVAKEFSRSVIAFEPQRMLAALLNRNAELNQIEKLLDTRGVALGAAEGEAVIEVNSLNLGNARVTQESASGEKITIRRLDQEIDKSVWKRVALIKIDVEGLELEVFKGMSALLNEHRPTLIFEVNATELAGRGHSGAMLCSLLKTYGYTTFFGLESVLYPPQNGVYPVANFVALSSADDAIIQRYGFLADFVPAVHASWKPVAFQF